MIIKDPHEEVEAFVDANEDARFLRLSKREILAMERGGDVPAYAIGKTKRKTWRFRLSRLANAFVGQNADPVFESKVSPTQAVSGN